MSNTTQPKRGERNMSECTLHLQLCAHGKLSKYFMALEVLSDFQDSYRSTGYYYRRVLAILYARCVCYCGQHVMCVVFRMLPIIAFKCSWLLQHYIPPSSLSHAWISLIGSIFAFQWVSACMHHQFTNCVIKLHNLCYANISGGSAILMTTSM